MTPPANLRRLLAARGRGAVISVHRGLWGAAPENSLPGIAAAEPIGIVEIDVQLAADGVPVVFHDPVLDRMTGATGPVGARDHRDLTALPLRAAAGGPNAAITEHRLPSLADVVAAAQPGSFFDFDAKHPHEVDAIAGWLARLGAQGIGSVKVDTQTADDIAVLLDLQRRHGLMVMAKVLLPRAGLGHIADLARAGVAAAEVWFDDLGQLAEACRIAGDAMPIGTYTLDPVHCCGLSDSLARTDPDAVWGRLLRAGVSIIMTDRAPDLAAWLERNGD